MNAIATEVAGSFVPLNPVKSRNQQRRSLARRNELVKQHQGLVWKAAHEYVHKCREPFADLVQIGNLGLIRAIDRFDTSKGAAFSSFAMPYIRGAILHYLRDLSHTVKVPRSWQEQYQAVKRKHRQQGEQACVKEVASDMGIDSTTWRSMSHAMNGKPLVLDDEICEEIDALQRDTTANYLEYMELYDAIHTLDESARLSIELVYLEQLSVRKAASKLGITMKQLEMNLQAGVAELAARLNGETTSPQP